LRWREKRCRRLRLLLSCLSKGGFVCGQTRARSHQRATDADAPIILAFIRELADYEKLLDSMSVTEEGLRSALFGPRPFAEAVIAFQGDESVAFASIFSPTPPSPERQAFTWKIFLCARLTATLALGGNYSRFWP
jgi:hypothetical protein